jgi:uncharacterized protein YegL
MPNKNKTEIVVIIDRSGSMNTMRDDAIGGFNAFIARQKELPGEASVTVSLFDHEYTLLYDGVDIHDVKPLDDTNYVPRGSTALYDAVGRTIHDVRARIKATESKKRPANVIVMVITDGQENCSREFQGSSVKELIEEQRNKSKWEVLFIGADESSLRDRQAMGIGMTRGAGGQSVTSSYIMSNAITADKIATGNLTADFIDGYSGGALFAAYNAIDTAVSNYRSKGTVGDWTNGEDLTKDKEV